MNAAIAGLLVTLARDVGPELIQELVERLKRDEDPETIIKDISAQTEERPAWATEILTSTRHIEEWLSQIHAILSRGDA